jgi:hypothetical protein
MNAEFDTRIAAWDRYWKGGHSDTCFHQGAIFSLRNDWLEFFAGLPDAARILDLATGNGALPLIAAEVSRADSRGFAITGVDFASPRPDLLPEIDETLLEHISFVGSTPLEDMDFEAASFDAVTSQYGFEYSDTRRSIPRIAELMAPGSRLRFLVHSSGGSVSKATEQRRARINQLLAKDQVLDLCRRISAGNPKDPSSLAKLRKVENRFWKKLKALRSKATGLPPDDVSVYAMNFVEQLVRGRNQIPPHEGRQALRELSDELHDYVIRLNGMLRAALTDSQMKTLVASFEEAGLDDVDYCPSVQDQDEVGWILTAGKR